MKRVLSFVLAVTFTLATLVGCGGGNTGTAPAASSTPASNASSEAPAVNPADKYVVTEPVKIEFWHALEEQYRAVLEGLVDEFEKQNPNITVDCLYQGAYADVNEKFIAANAAGGADLPGLMVVNAPALMAYAQSGVVENLDTYISDTQFPIDEFAAGMREAFTVDGSQYCLPFLNSAYVWFYNKTAAEAEGITMPKTWAEMDEFMTKATTANRKALCFGGWDSFYYESLFWNRGVEFANADRTKCGLDSDVAIETAQQMQKWCDDGKAFWAYGKGASSTMRQAFSEGGYFAICHTTAIFQTYNEICNFDVGVAFIPGDKTRNSEIGGCGLGIPTNIDQNKKNAGWALLQFLTSPESNMTLVEATGYLPTRTTTLKSDAGKAYLAKYPALEELFSMLDNVKPQPQIASFDTMKKLFVDAMGMAINEKGDIKAALADCVVKCDEILQDA